MAKKEGKKTTLKKRSLIHTHYTHITKLYIRLHTIIKEEKFYLWNASDPPPPPYPQKSTLDPPYYTRSYTHMMMLLRTIMLKRKIIVRLSKQTWQIKEKLKTHTKSVYFISKIPSKSGIARDVINPHFLNHALSTIDNPCVTYFISYNCLENYHTYRLASVSEFDPEST